jgi:DNA-binding NtrC family response regulator
MGDTRPGLCLLGESGQFEAFWSRLAKKHEIGLVPLESLEADAAASDILIICAPRDEHEGALELLQQADRAGVVAPAVVGSHADHRLAVAVMRRGAAGYFALPVDEHRLEAFVAEQIARRGRTDERRALDDFRSKSYGFDAIIGEDEGLKAALDRAAKVIPSRNATVLITGETGTGKDVLARAIHYAGPRRESPFVPLNCSAIPADLMESELFGHERGAFTGAGSSKPGLLEVADGGTLFLDEVATLELDLQAKLLRALETHVVRRVGGLKSIQVDFRVIAATNQDLAECVRQGGFRRDLYYRLAVILIHLPPLRERGTDALLIARHFLTELSKSYGVSRPELTRAAEGALARHHWPGNVRELRNVIERGLLMSDGQVIEAEDLSLLDDPGQSHAEPAVRAKSPIPFPSSLREMEEAAARAMIELCNGNKSRAARRLGITRSRLYSLLQRAETKESKSEALT